MDVWIAVSDGGFVICVSPEREMVVAGAIEFLQNNGYTEISS